MNLQKANGETLYQFYDIVGIFFTIGRTLKPNLKWVANGENLLLSW